MKELKELTELNQLKMPKIHVLKFWAPWCAPCRMLAPIMDKVITDNFSNSTELEFWSVNVDDVPAIASHFGVRSIPVVLQVQDKEVLERKVGAIDAKTLKTFLEKHVANPSEKGEPDASQV